MQKQDSKQSMTSPAVIPNGMREVTQAEFFELLKADSRDIMPSLVSPHFTSWETTSRQVWGWSVPGWKNPGEVKRYAVGVR